MTAPTSPGTTTAPGQVKKIVKPDTAGALLGGSSGAGTPVKAVQ